MENSSTDELKLLEIREFKTRDDFISAAQEFATQRGYGLSIKRSKKDTKVILGCDRGGHYRNRINKPIEDRIRNTASRLIGCPFELHGKRKHEGYWMLHVKNSFHNHDPSVDISGHPISRRFSKDEIAGIKDLIKSGVPTRQIISTLRLANPNIQSVSKTVRNLKAKLRNEYLNGRTTVQALLDELSNGGFTYEFLSDANGFLTHLFFVHPMSLALTKSYSSVFVMDCTYKTNKYKMPLFEIVGISSFNTSFCSCFAFLRKEEQSDYIWVLEMFKKIFGDGSLPSVIVTDRELALMNALQAVFPTSAHILCTWHIEKNILAHCKRYFGDGEDWDGFLVAWTSVVNSFTELEYIEALKTFEDKYKDKMLALSYIRNTWLPYKEYFVSAWTDKYTHFGTRVSSRAESTHAMIKKYLQVSTGDFCEVKNKICHAIKNQFQEIKVQLESEKVRAFHRFHIPLFKDLISRVSLFALNKLWQQYELSSSENELPSCKCQFVTTMGLPCAHRLRSLQHRSIPMGEIHQQWRIDMRFFVDDQIVESTNKDDHFKQLLKQLEIQYEGWSIERKEAAREQLYRLVNDSSPVIYEPIIQSHRGRPTNSKSKRKNSSTRRDPSGFEMVENIRVCSKCKRSGHNCRTCPDNSAQSSSYFVPEQSSYRSTSILNHDDNSRVDVMSFAIADEFLYNSV